MARLLVNPPCRVLFAGWEANTFSLGNAGWDISIEESMREPFEVTRMLLSFKPKKLLIMAECNRFSTLSWRRGMGTLSLDGDLPVFHARDVCTDYRLVSHEHGPVRFGLFNEWADHRPAMVERSIYETPLFLAREKPVAEELIVDQEDVQTLLDRIRKMQEPGQAEIRKRRRAEAPPVAHATIISLAA